MKYVLLNWDKWKAYEKQTEWYELLDLLRNDTDFYFTPNLSLNEIKTFIISHNQENIGIIFPVTGRATNTFLECIQEMTQCLHFINNTLKETNLTFYFIPSDVFYCATNAKLLELINASQRDNIKIIYTMLDLDDYTDNVSTKNSNTMSRFEEIRGKLPQLLYPEKVLFSPYINYAYELCFIPFNDNPINKISLGGHIEGSGNNEPYYERLLYHNTLKNYPTKYERIIGDRTDRIPSSHNPLKNKFSLSLNKYLCSIYTGVWDFKKSLVLLKFYEILGSGSLLLVSITQKLICDKLNLVENKHYKTINIYDITGMMTTIDYILDLNNRTEIDQIRKNGQEFCFNHFRADTSYKVFKTILE